MTITRTQAATLIELQAMIAWDDVPRVSSSDDASAELVSDGVAAIAVDEARVVEAKVVDIGDGGGPAASSSSRSLGERREGGRGSCVEERRQRPEDMIRGWQGSRGLRDEEDFNRVGVRTKGQDYDGPCMYMLPLVMSLITLITSLNPRWSGD